MSAERLREAARVLRERAEAAGEQASTLSHHKTGTSLDALPPVTWYGDGADWRDPECRYIATTHPGVGLALADLLDHEAYRISRTLDAVTGRTWHQAHPSVLAVADAILGGAA
jgi:hypothetical protein